MSSDLQLFILAMAICVTVVTSFLYIPIGIFLVARSAYKADFTITEFCLSLLLMTGVVSSGVTHSGDISSARLYVGMAFTALVFTASLGFLAETFFKLLNEEKRIFHRFIATQGVLGAMFVEIFGWLWLFESYVSITVNYPLFIVIAIALVAVNFIIHARSANFRRSAISVSQASAATLLPIGVCWWIIFVNWYGLALIYFCLCIWIVQLTSGLRVVVSKSKFARWTVFSLLIVWIVVGGTVSYNFSEPWLS